MNVFENSFGLQPILIKKHRISLSESDRGLEIDLAHLFLVFDKSIFSISY